MSAIERLCRRVRPHFSDHLDGEPLPPRTAFVVRMHLTFCPLCKRTYASMIATREALAALRDESSDPSPSEG